MVMDGPESRALQSLDSFWFFSNIFSRKTQNPPVMVGVDVRDGDRSVVEAEAILPEKPISEIIQIETDESVMCLKCGGNGAVEEVETPPRASSGEKRRGRRRSKRSHQRREIFGELDMGSVGSKEGSWRSNWLVLEEVERYVSSPSPSPRKGGQNLPPLNVNDGMAMKEHLKSWAYAVACTVK